MNKIASTVMMLVAFLAGGLAIIPAPAQRIAGSDYGQTLSSKKVKGQVKADDKDAKEKKEVKEIAYVPGKNWKANPKFRTGLRKTPRHLLLRSVRFRPARGPPANAAWVAKTRSMFLNDTYGDCVTAEEAWNLSAYTQMVSGTAVMVPNATVQAWAAAGDYLNGADLTSVMDSMIKDPWTVNNVKYPIGPYKSVDYSTESVLQAALAIGPVKIGIDSSALPSGAGNKDGWVGTGGRPQEYRNEDHCVSITGYGTGQWLATALGIAVPSGISATGNYYLLYTWSTVGIVDHAWLMSTCGEAWIRQPPIVGIGPVPPPPPPPPPPSGLVSSALLTFTDGSTQELMAGSNKNTITITPLTTMADLVAAMNAARKKK